VDRRTDIFSLGILLYEMASGRRPFTGASAAELGSALLRDTPPPLTAVRPDLPGDVERVVVRCLEKDPAARFQSMHEVRGALAGSAVARESTPGPAPRFGRRARTLLTVSAVLALAVVAVLLATRFRLLGPSREGQGPAAASSIRSVAVLPLDNYSGDPDQDYFSEGMTDELTADLARVSRLRVISRGSAMQFKGGNRPSTPEIAKALDVDAVVEGSVFRSGDRVRITAQLIDARADRHLWAQSFERSSQDVLSLQDELASAIAQAIHVQLTPAEKSRLSTAPTVNPEAYDAYLKGRYFFNRPSDANLQKAIARFEEAIGLDSTFAPAFSGLSDAYLWAGYNEGFLTASEARPKAKEAAEKAVRLDGNSAEAHTSLAVFKLFYEYDWAGSEAEFRRAIALDPNYAYAPDQFGLGLAFQGRFEESIAQSRHAAELDPLNPQIPIDAGFAPTWQGHYETAMDLARRAAELDPTSFFPDFAYGYISIQAGKVQDATSHFKQAQALDAPAFVSAWLAYAYGASGDSAGAMAELEDLKTLSLHGSPTAFNLALVYLGVGDYPRAVSYLEQAYATDSQWLGWLGEDRTFDPLRPDPRFIALMRKLHFEN